MHVLNHPIVHLDADAFFASVEQAADRRLRGIPMAVGGLLRGIIASASYEARSRGIYTPMSTQRALKLCPDLTVVPGQYELYEEFSDNIFGLCENITPMVERSSIDEGYMSTAGWPELGVDSWKGIDRRGPGGAALRGRYRQIAHRVHQLDDEILRWMKITVSTGVAGNKLVSNVASKLRKPHGFVMVPPGAEQAFLSPLPVRRMPGIGPSMGGRIAAIGVKTIGDLVRLGADGLRPFFGSMTDHVLNRARGVDHTPLSLGRGDAKSYGHQQTFQEDIGDFEQVVRIAKGMIDELLPKIRKDKKQARTLTLRIRYNDMVDTTHQRSMQEPADLEDDFYPWVRPMLRKLWTRRVPLRLVGVSFSHIYDTQVQPELFHNGRVRRRDLVRAVDEINAKFNRGGKPGSAIKRACHLFGKS